MIYIILHLYNIFMGVMRVLNDIKEVLKESVFTKKFLMSILHDLTWSIVILGLWIAFLYLMYLIITLQSL